MPTRHWVGKDKVVNYADRCLLTKPFMVKHGLVFKKIPRDISRF
jgi:adenine-specific DNA-methyltransferase